MEESFGDWRNDSVVERNRVKNIYLGNSNGILMKLKDDRGQESVIQLRV